MTRKHVLLTDVDLFEALAKAEKPTAKMIKRICDSKKELAKVLLAPKEKQLEMINNYLMKIYRGP